jgi:hypothetical protein
MAWAMMAKPATIAGWSVRSINGDTVILVGSERTSAYNPVVPGLYF